MSNISVGIYGDSFAEVNHDSLDLGPSWVELLKTKYQVINYANPGKSPYKCYIDYLRNKHSHDVNIFVCPSTNRFHSDKLSLLLKDVDELRNINHSWYIGHSSIEILENRLKAVIKNKPNDSKLLKKLQIVENVKFSYENWIDFDYIEDTNKILAEKIKKEKNLIFIDASSMDNNSLLKLCFWELEQLDYKSKYSDNGLHLGYADVQQHRVLRDQRKNHLSDENNLILFEKISNLIENKKYEELVINHDDFVVPAGPIEKYINWMKF
jgi:hypothetical protein